VNAAGQRKREEALGGLDDHGDGMARMTKNKLGFGIVLRFLMKLFDRRHFASGLGSLDAVGQQHDAPVDGEEMGLENTNNSARSSGGELRPIHGRAVKEIQESVIELLSESEGSDKACDAVQIAARGKRRQGGNEPKERAIAGEGWAKTKDGISPSKPESHKSFLFKSCIY